MKNKKKFTFVVVTAISLVAFPILSINTAAETALAHSLQLNVSYDTCSPEHWYSQYDIGDGEEEKWYELINAWRDNNNVYHQRCYHLPQNTNIKYYFSPVGKDDTSLTWNTFFTNTESEYIINSIKTSIEKWNNVYFYYQNGSNSVVKQKLINLSEGDLYDHNLTIYPWYDQQQQGATYARMGCFTTNSQHIDTLNGIEHYHYDEWYMEFNVNDNIFNQNQDFINFILERTPAHEIGHMLGLFDIDKVEWENSSDPNNYGWHNCHHEELLMGYSSGGMMTRQKNITYKDLIGVAITRGFHVDNDHSWIYDPNNSSFLFKKFICSICNAVSYSTSYPSSYVTYKQCNDNHALSSGNMFAVASYGNNDYYKCKYCRYVEPFENIVTQNYTYTSTSSTTHNALNQVNGLAYSFSELHDMVNNTCSKCGYHEHNYVFTSITSSKHVGCCSSCNASINEPHTVGPGFGLLRPCLICGYLVNIGDTPVIQGIDDIQYSDSGSYILPNGIMVLVEEDLESFFNGTLSFHYHDETTE